MNSPEEKSNSSDAVTVREINTDEQITPDVDVIDGSILQNTEMTNSYTDSGHFEDYTNSPVGSKASKFQKKSVQPDKSQENKTKRRQKLSISVKNSKT